MSIWLQEIRLAVRQLRKNLGSTLVAILCLAIGIGANSTVFSLVDSILFRPLPVKDPDRLVRIYTSEWSADGASNRLYGASSLPDYRALRERRDVFTGVAAFMTNSLALAQGSSDAVVINAALVSADFFEVLGVEPYRGQTLFTGESDPMDSRAVAVLSYKFWQQHFHGDHDILGKSVRITDVPVVIVGIAPQKFRGIELEGEPDLWIPLGTHLQVMPRSEWLQKGDSRGLAMIARLASGVSLVHAKGVLHQLAQQRALEFPSTNSNRRFTLTPGRTFLSPGGPPTAVFALLGAVVALVLVIACANVANLLLARGASRRREMAIRIAIGASRPRLIRQLLVEGFVLAMLASAAGLLLAFWSLQGVQLLPLPKTLDLAVNGRIVLFTVAIAGFSVLLFALAPALRTTGKQLDDAIRQARPVGSTHRSRLRKALVLIQISLSVVLLVPAGLLVRTLQKLYQADPGYEYQNVLILTPNLQAGRYSAAESEAFLESVMERMRELPEVEAVSVASTVPLSNTRMRYAMSIEGYERAQGEDSEVDVIVVGREYFRTLQIPIVAGRPFTATDRSGSPLVAIVSETMARRYWPDRSPLGQRMFHGLESRENPIEIVGVARDAAQEKLQANYPYFYLVAAQNPQQAEHILVRTGGDPLRIAKSARAIFRSTDPKVVLMSVRTLTEMRAESLDEVELTAGFIGVFGGLALLLAAIGLYGVMAYATSLRTREIGVRMALGARQPDVLKLIAYEGVRITLTGLGIGVLVAFGASRVLSGVLYQVAPTDPGAFAGVIVLLSAVAMIACLIPAVRATRVDPAVTLRYE